MGRAESGVVIAVRSRGRCSRLLYFSRWKIVGLISTAAIATLFAVPNLMLAKIVDRWPQWAQRHVVMGLDLRSGSYLLFEVDAAAVRQEMAETLRDEVRRTLREAHASYTELA